MAVRHQPRGSAGRRVRNAVATGGAASWWLADSAPPLAGPFNPDHHNKGVPYAAGKGQARLVAAAVIPAGE